MKKQKQPYHSIFLIVSVLATVFVLTEIVLQAFGTSICSTEGCKMTARSARFGDVSIFLIGFGIFFSIASLSILNRKLRKPELERVINLILIVALAGEGFFMGYLAFRIHIICLFCVSVFLFMATLGICRLLSGETDVLAGFGAFAAVFIIQYLVLPAGVPVNLPMNERLILFYSEDCKHCAAVSKELDEKKLHVAHLQVAEYVGFLKNMGIESIPTLMVNDPYQKVFLTGEEAINRYLLVCSNPKAAEVKPTRKVKAHVRTKTVAPDKSMTLDIFGQPGLLTSPALSGADNGMCKEDEICK